MMQFALPWNSVLLCVVCVFLVVFVTMMYAMAKIRKGNIVDVLKNDTQ